MSKNKLIIKMDSYKFSAIKNYFGDTLDAAAEELLLHIAMNGTIDGKQDIGSKTKRFIVRNGSGKTERDIIQLVAGWLSRGDVKNIDEALPKLRDWGTNYPIFHLWPEILKHKKKIKERIKAQQDGNMES